MGGQRKGNERFYLGKNVLGKNSWMLREDAKRLGSTGKGSTTNLLDASSEGLDLAVESGLVKPSPELLKRLQKNRDWSGLDLSGLDLRGVFNDGFLPSRVDGTDFSDSDLRGVSFTAVSGTGVNFTGALTEGMVFGKGTSLTDIVSGGLFDMTDTSLGGSELRFAEPTRLVGLNSMKAMAGGNKLGGIDFSGETLSSRNLIGFDEMHDSDFTRAEFKDGQGYRFFIVEVKFINCDFTDVSMTDVDLRGGVFSSCRFEGANLTGWNLNDRSKFYDCDFGDANLSGWGFAEYTSLGVNWYGDNKLGEVDLTGADGELVRHLLDSDVGVKGYRIRDAASRIGLGADELGVFAWLGEIEVRDLDTCEVVEGVIDNTVWVPEWSLRKLKTTS